MTVLALVLLGLVPVLGGVVALRGERGRLPWGAVSSLALLTVAAVLGWAAGPAAPGVAVATAVVAVAAAALGGGPVATAVLRAADPTRAMSAVGPTTGGIADPEVLRGGAWIGVLERLAVAATVLVGWREGVPVVLAVKGLGRFAELRATPAAERFIIGTLTSVLWAAGCVGVAVLVAR